MVNKNILLVGEWESSNLGDQILCSCVEYILKENLLNINVFRFDISNGLGLGMKKKIKWLPYRLFYKFFSDKDNRNLCYSRLKASWIKKDLKSIKNKIDLIIFCGGQMFMDYFAHQIESVVEYSRKKSIPIFWNACGAGKCNETTIQILKNCLRNSPKGYLTVRDNLKFFSDVLKADPVLVPDPALFSSSFKSDIAENIDPIIGIGIMDPSSFKQYKIDKNSLTLFIQKLIKKLIKDGYRIELFTNGAISDELYLKEIYDNLYTKDVSVASRPQNGADLINIISSYKKIISFRLHSHIVSYSCKIPSYGIIWDNKVKDFFVMTGNENNTCMLHELNIQKIENFVKMGNTSFQLLDKFKSKAIESLIIACEKILMSDK